MATAQPVVDPANPHNLDFLPEPEELGDIENPKETRCASFSHECSGHTSGDKMTYLENTSKEELVLEHVLEYQRQFKIIYDPLRDLLIAPKNECGKRKFICSTLRPTKLPFTALYDYAGCAKFTANYLEYEELAEPNRLPEIMPSPANVIKWQAGDCFDFAIVLCSLLLGTGYDAYVVYGTAPKNITTKDESLMECPFSLDFDDEMDAEDPHYDADEKHMHKKPAQEDNPFQEFAVVTKQPHKSVFEDEQHLKKVTEERIRHFREVTIDDDEPDFEPEDEHGRSRIHAWVLILAGERDVKESFFIEPTTSRKYALDNSPYHTCESIFNHQNFWVNLDPTRPIESIDVERFNEDVNGEWEYVMIKKKEKKENEDDEGAEPASEDEFGDEEDVLDMPPPWSPKLVIDKEKFAEGVKNGAKTVFYKKCKVDFYSECKQVDGLVKRVTLYEDFRRIITKEIRSYYQNRKDRLVVRRRFPYQFKLIEHFQSVQPSHWKKMIQVDGKSRKLYFYHHRVRDGLIYREEHVGRKTFEYYKGREDKLIYRSVTFDGEREKDPQALVLNKELHTGKDVTILKMTQKFELDPLLPAESQIKKTEFNLDKKKVFVFYHYVDGKITATDSAFNRDDLIGQAKISDMNDKEQEDSQTAQTQKKIIDMEQKCHEQIKEYERYATTELQSHNDNEKQIHQQRSTPSPDDLFAKILEKSITAKARDRMKKELKKTEEDTGKKQPEDALGPIMKKLNLEKHSKTEALEEEPAIAVKNEALRSLKERLLTRAEIIQRRLEEEQNNLTQKFTEFKRKGETYGSADQQTYQAEVKKANFKIDILTERAAQHYRNSLEKFQQLDQQLQNDPRLANLNGGRNPK